MFNRTALVTVGIFVCATGAVRPALAQTPSAARSRVRQAVVFLGGAAAGLVVHEAGHVLTGVTFDASPRVVGLRAGPIPFFAIRHDPVSRRQEFVISSAGLWAQHGVTEWILTTRPRLRHHPAPFAKGMLAFSVSTSVVYGFAAFGRLGPPERDTRGMALSLGTDGVPEPVVGLLVLGPAVLDGYRYLRPESTWATWTSRTLKITAVALTIAAGR